MRFGLDYSAGTISPAAHRAVGSSFACRYLSLTASKNLSRGEADQLRHGQISIVTVWETSAMRWLAGHGAGVEDAKLAQAQAETLGKPGPRPIYFAVDFDETPGQAAAAADYFRGVNSILGIERTGVYGDFYVGERLANAGLIRYFWQTYAWSGGQISRHAQLYQFSNGHQVAGRDCDYNHALAPDFGQWDFAAPTPAKPPTPAAPAPTPYDNVRIELDVGIDPDTGTWRHGEPKLTPLPKS